MSLEDKLDALTEALNANTELLKTLTSKAKSASTAAPEAKDEKGEKTTRTRRTATPKAPSVAELKKLAEDFLEGADGEEDYNARRGVLKEIVAKFDAPKLTEIEEASRAEAVELLKAEVEKYSAPAAKDDDVV